VSDESNIREARVRLGDPLCCDGWIIRRVNDGAVLTTGHGDDGSLLFRFVDSLWGGWATCRLPSFERAVALSVEPDVASAAGSGAELEAVQVRVTLETAEVYPLGFVAAIAAGIERSRREVQDWQERLKP
jgi:hypothetical protein